MKKQISLLLAVVLAILCCLSPLMLGTAADKAKEDALYEVSQTVYADAYMLIDLNEDSHPLLAQKNKDKKKYPASLTKIATAMVILNNMKDLQQKTTVSQGAIEMLAGTDAQIVGLSAGEEVTMEKLLSLIMVYSACDACNVAAEAIAGSVSAFVEMMNDWAKKVGCTSTHFVNCDGLHDDDHYTTAEDMARMTLAAMENDIFMQICTQTYVDFHEIRYYHTNFMLDDSQPLYYYKYAKGIKTGSTSEAGYCVVTTAAKGDYRYLAIVMDSPMQDYEGEEAKYSFIDAATLFDWAFDSLHYATVLKQGQSAIDIKLTRAKDADSVPLVSSTDIKVLVPTTADADVKIEPIDPPEELQAPLKKGEKICKANIVYNKQVLATVELQTGNAVELSTFFKCIAFLKAHLLVILICMLVLALFIFIIIKLRKRTANKEKAKVKVKEKKEAPQRRKRHEKSEKQRQYEAYKRQQARENDSDPLDY